MVLAQLAAQRRSLSTPLLLAEAVGVTGGGSGDQALLLGLLLSLLLSLLRLNMLPEPGES